MIQTRRTAARPACVIAGVVMIAASMGAGMRPAAATDFFAGKTITMSSHTAPGNSYDLYLRLLSRHYGRHIPGNPSFVVINQPGGGGLRSFNHAGVVAPQDGTFLTIVSQALLIFEATGQRGLQVSLGKFQWLGSFHQSNNVTVTWHSSKVRTLADAMAREVTVGATGSGAGSIIGPAIYNAVLGTKFKMIAGYPGGAEIDIAMQRGEVEGRGNNTWAGYKATFQTAIKEGKLNVLIQTGLRKERDLPDVPLFLDLVRGDQEKELIADFMSRAVAIARPFAAPPGVPKDRVELLRRAWDATMADPKFLAEAAKLEAEIDPLNGREVQDIVERVLATPKPAMNRIQAVLGLPAN
jgi:tripartite-type tricarboxylate transporter receptor subunit TctC